MKKGFHFLGTSVIALFLNNVNAMPTIDGDFLGINVSKEHCRIQTADGSFGYMGEAEVKYTMNKNFIIANCKAEYLQEEDDMEDEAMEGMNALEEALVERAEVPCRIAVKNPDSTARPKMIHYDGFGGFTVTPSGQVIGKCKTPK